MQRTFNFGHFVKLLILFGLVQVLGLIVADTMLVTPGAIQPEDIGAYSATDGIVALVAATVFILVVVKFRKAGGALFKIILALLILGGVQTVFDLWLRADIAFYIAVIAVILFTFFNTLLTQNVIMVIALSGLGALIGLSVTPMLMVAVLAVLSIYDIWAVYKTKHMIAMAESMIASRAISGVVVPTEPKRIGAKLDQIKPGGGYLLLGSGDIVLPLAFAVSLLPTSSYQALMVTIFSAVGLFVMYWLLTSQKEPRPMAALPPIAAMSIIGYLISLL